MTVLVHHPAQHKYKRKVTPHYQQEGELWLIHRIVPSASVPMKSMDIPFGKWWRILAVKIAVYIESMLSRWIMAMCWGLQAFLRSDWQSTCLPYHSDDDIPLRPSRRMSLSADLCRTHIHPVRHYCRGLVLFIHSLKTEGNDAWGSCWNMFMRLRKTMDSSPDIWDEHFPVVCQSCHSLKSPAHRHNPSWQHRFYIHGYLGYIIVWMIRKTSGLSVWTEKSSVQMTF